MVIKLASEMGPEPVEEQAAKNAGLDLSEAPAEVLKIISQESQFPNREELAVFWRMGSGVLSREPVNPAETVPRSDSV